MNSKYYILYESYYNRILYGDNYKPKNKIFTFAEAQACTDFFSPAVLKKMDKMRAGTSYKVCYRSSNSDIYVRCLGEKPELLDWENELEDLGAKIREHNEEIKKLAGEHVAAIADLNKQKVKLKKKIDGFNPSK